MSLTLGDNFSFQGAKPLDARLKYDTLAAMKAVGDATMYEGCLAYCVATDKTYQWKSSNTVDTDTGKWREFETGGGEDANAYHTGDTAETTLADGDYFPFYDTSASGKRKTLWSNIKAVLKNYFDSLYASTFTIGYGLDKLSNNTLLVPALDYDTSEKVIGRYFEGSTLYSKTISLGKLPNNTTSSITHNISGTFTVVEICAFAYNGTTQLFLPYTQLASNVCGTVFRDGNYIKVLTNFDASSYKGYVTIRYIKRQLP